MNSSHHIRFVFTYCQKKVFPFAIESFKLQKVINLMAFRSPKYCSNGNDLSGWISNE